jgi:hypothetical protein
MKVGYLRYSEDDNYVIPEDMIEECDKLWSKIEGKYYSECVEDFDIFEDKYDEYRVEGELYDMKIIMDEE